MKIFLADQKGRRGTKHEALLPNATNKQKINGQKVLTKYLQFCFKHFTFNLGVEIHIYKQMHIFQLISINKTRIQFYFSHLAMWQWPTTFYDQVARFRAAFLPISLEAANLNFKVGKV